MTPTPDYAGLIESLNHRASTMNGAEPVDSGDGHTYVTGYYTVSDRMLDREAATALRTFSDSVEALQRDIETFWKVQFDDQVDRAEAAEAERDRLAERVAELKKALEPFSKFAGPVFERNFNKPDIITKIEAADGDLVTLTAGDFFTARSLVKEDAEPKFIVDDNGNTGWVIP